MLTEQQRDTLRAGMTERDMEIIQRHLLRRFNPSRLENGRRRSDADPLVQALQHGLRPPAGDGGVPAVRVAAVARVARPARPVASHPVGLVRAEGAGHRPRAGAADLSRRVVTRNEAAELTRMSLRTIAQMMHDGLVEVIYTANGRPRIVEASLWRTPEP